MHIYMLIVLTIILPLLPPYKSVVITGLLNAIYAMIALGIPYRQSRLFFVKFF